MGGMMKTFAATAINERGQCSNCLVKPIPYKRQGRWFCYRCNRDYSMKTGEQVTNWAWEKRETGAFLAAYPDSDYVRAAPSKAALRRAPAQVG